MKISGTVHISEVRKRSGCIVETGKSKWSGGFIKVGQTCCGVNKKFQEI